MKKLTMYSVALLFASSAGVLYVQTQEEPKAKFTLAISEYHHELGPRFNRVSTIVTNTSKQVFLEPGCSDMRDLYHVSVFYNGDLLDEKDATARHRMEAQRAAFCTHELGINPIPPGKQFQVWFDLADRYDLSRPGTYDVTVSRETDPDHPDKSVTVKSNTLTVVVPELEDGEPK